MQYNELDSLEIHAKRKKEMRDLVENVKQVMLRKTGAPAPSNSL